MPDLFSNCLCSKHKSLRNPFVHISELWEIHDKCMAFLYFLQRLHLPGGAVEGAAVTPVVAMVAADVPAVETVDLISVLITKTLILISSSRPLMLTFNSIEYISYQLLQN